MANGTRWLDDDEQRLWRTYLYASSRLTTHIDADLRRRGLDIAEYEILVQLSESPQRRLRMAELADAVNQSRSRLTHTIKRLEKRQIVARVHCPTDRRGVWAELTEAGMRLLTATAPDHVETVRSAFIDVIDPADRDALRRTFAAVLAAVDADPSAPGKTSPDAAVGEDAGR